jgi:rhodanese-related sulfurtransferase
MSFSFYFIMRALHCLKPSINWNPVNAFFNDPTNIVLAIAALASGLALMLPGLRPAGKRASTLQVTQMMNRAKTIVVDVSTPEEFAKGHLRDAKNIPLSDFPARIGELEKSKGKSVVVVCQTGARSDKAVKLLQNAGFDDVVSLDGGLAAWKAAGLPTVK